MKADGDQMAKLEAQQIAQANVVRHTPQRLRPPSLRLSDQSRPRLRWRPRPPNRG